jgi:hypothetical protein
MSYVIAIDVGIRNMGLCVYDFMENKVIFWTNTCLTNERYIPSHNVAYVRDYVLKYREYFDNACMVVVERQMQTNMRIIEALFQQCFYDKCVVISPRSCKAHYGLCMKDYKANKVAAIAWADAFTANNKAVVPEFTWTNKKDDMADALMLVMYYLDTYSPQWD